MLERAERILLLIHGFNVSTCDAVDVYEQFLDGLLFRWKARAICVYWPGDEAVNLPGRAGLASSQIVGALAYTMQPDKAKAAALVLARYFGRAVSTRRRALRVSVVAHSLGCRVALQFLRDISSNPKIEIELVALMAAAVPKYDVDAGGEYDMSFSTAKKVLIYHSTSDTVLAGVFTAGQSFASTSVRTLFSGRDALGLRGMHGLVGDRFEQIETKHRHGDYWPDPDIPRKVIRDLEGRTSRRARRVLVGRFVYERGEIQGRLVRGRELRWMAQSAGCGCC